jgi:hypothetical protein
MSKCRLFDVDFSKEAAAAFKTGPEGSAVLAFELALRVYVTLFAMVGRREQVAGKQNWPCFFEDHCNLTARTHDDRKALKRFDRIVCGGWHVMPTLVLSSPLPIGDAHQKRIAMMSAPQQMFDTEHMMEVGELRRTGRRATL